MGPKSSRSRQRQNSKFSKSRDRRKLKKFLDGGEGQGTSENVEPDVNSGQALVKMKLSILKHMVVTFLGSPGATHRRAQLSLEISFGTIGLRRALPPRLFETCNDTLNVEGLCRAFPQRLQKLVDRDGDRISH